jgi:hypothetical protein
MNKKLIIDRARIFEARQASRQGDFHRALGWLRGVSDDNEGFSAMQAEIVAQARKDEINHGSVVKQGSSNGNEKPFFLAFIGQMPVWSEYLLIFVFLFLFFKLIFRLRKLLLPKLKMAWSGDMQINLLFRWLVIGATGLVGAWFIRFLIIAMIPYSGIAALTALQRIMLAELLVIFLWLGLSWQMKRWESDKCATAALCTDWRSKKNLKLLFWLLFISSIPVFAAITDNGRLGCDIPVSQMILGIFILLAGGWAFSRAIWRWTAAWMTGSSAVAHLGPAFIYALFRGGLAPDPWASLFALAAGFQISRLVAAQKSPTVGFIADIALTFPALIMVIGWFPAVDPIVGVWNIDSAPSMWWLVPTLLLFLMRMQKEVANQPNQL